MAAAIFISFFPAAAFRAEAHSAYVVQGTAIPLKGYPNGAPSYGHRECWAFAQKVYNNIWGKSFNGFRGTRDDLLRNIGTGSAREITAENTRRFVTAAALGATIRIAEVINGADSEGDHIHSQILVQKDTKGFTIYHSTDSRISTVYYTWAKFASAWKNNKYFKYIKFPNAPKYSDELLLPPEAPLPKNAVIAVSKTKLLEGEKVTFNFSADNTKGGRFVLHLYKGKTNIDNPSVRTGRYTESFDEIGAYSAYITAYNASGGSCNSARVSFSVLPPNPGVPVLKVAGENKSTEPINFTWAETWATTKYKLTVYDNTNATTIDSITGTSCSAELPVGSYVAVLTSINGKSNDLETEGRPVSFVVAPPLTCKLKQTLASFSWPADSKASTYNLRIMKIENKTEKLYRTALGVTGISCSRGSLPEGSYRAYVDAVGSGDYLQKSCDVFFTVTYLRPSQPKLSVAATTKSADSVNLTWSSAENAKNYSLSIWKGDALVKTIARIKGTSYSIKLAPGKYTANVSAVNTDYPNCKTASSKAAFTVAS